MPHHRLVLAIILWSSLLTPAFQPLLLPPSVQQRHDAPLLARMVFSDVHPYGVGQLALDVGDQVRILV